MDQSENRFYREKGTPDPTMDEQARIGIDGLTKDRARELNALRGLVAPVRALVERINVETRGWYPDDVVAVVCALSRIEQ